MARKERREGTVVAHNRKARRDYLIEDVVEAGIVLEGSEVKSLRKGGATISESYASPRQGEIFLLDAHIAVYEAASRFGHEPTRPRKLLLHKRQIDRLTGAVRRDGMTLVPLSIYFNDRGVVKLSLALARGKRQYDKRQAEKERTWRREKDRLMRQKG